MCCLLYAFNAISLFSLISLESPAALAVSSQNPHQKPGRDLVRVSNPSILISRATRGKQLKAALDRDVANSKELRHLDEFLGTQVRMGWSLFNSHPPHATEPEAEFPNHKMVQDNGNVQVKSKACVWCVLRLES